MVDRLVHHSEIINLKGDYRLKDRRKGHHQRMIKLSRIRPSLTVQDSTAVDNHHCAHRRATHHIGEGSRSRQCPASAW
jgi:hypothetical protein